MKITRSQLKKLIKEELEGMTEADRPRLPDLNNEDTLRAIAAGMELGALMAGFPGKGIEPEEVFDPKTLGIVINALYGKEKETFKSDFANLPREEFRKKYNIGAADRTSAPLGSQGRQ